MVELLEKPATRARVGKISVKGYHSLYEQGYIDEKNELIRGVIIQKMPKSPQHVYAIKYIIACLNTIFSDNFCIRKEDPLTLRDSEPEPDIAVVEGRDIDFAAKHPSTARLVVEVSKTTYDLDFDKGLLYAEANIEAYWLVNLDKGETEVFSNPQNGRYTKHQIFTKGSSISLEGHSVSLDMVYEKASV